MRRGTLPPGQLGVKAVDAIRDGVTLISEAAAVHITGQQPTAIDLSLSLGGRWLTGTVTDVYGTALVRASYTSMSARHRVAAWVRLLAAAAATGTGGWQAVTIGRVKDDAPSARRSTLTVPADPAGLLAQLVGLRDRGLAAPLPLAPRASSTYAGRRLSGASPQEAWSAAALAWTSEGHGAWRRGERTTRMRSGSSTGMMRRLKFSQRSRPSRTSHGPMSRTDSPSSPALSGSRCSTMNRLAACAGEVLTHRPAADRDHCHRS